MNYKLITFLIATFFAISTATYASSLREEESSNSSRISSHSTLDDNSKSVKSFRVPWILKPLCFFGLLTSPEVVEAQAIPNIKPYQELNFTNYLKMNYEDGDMPQGSRITKQYSWIPTYPPTVSPSYAPADSLCVLLQAKIQRSWELREISDYLYQDIQESSSLSIIEKYVGLWAAANIELGSHMLEMEAALQLVGGTDSSACAFPTPMWNQSKY